MQAVRESALQAADDTGRQITAHVAWFYLRHLGKTGLSLSAVANALLTRGERMALPEPQGEREKAVRSGLCTRSALLEAQLYDTINAYTKQFSMNDIRTPEAIRRRMNERLTSFTEQTARALGDKLAACFRQGNTADQTAEALEQVFARAAKQLAADIETCYTKASWYQVLQQCTAAGYNRFHYIVERTDDTCNTCLSQGGQTYTLEQLVQLDLLPPLHPNCRCAIVPEDGGRSLHSGRETENWYDPLLRIPSDALVLLKGIAAAQQERLSQGTLAGLLDWLTMGIVSGFFGGLKERDDALWEQPSAYRAVNWLTMGTADLVKGAVDPDEPLSLEHWLNSLGVALIIVGAYKSAQDSIPALHQNAKDLAPGSVPDIPSNTKELIRAADRAERVTEKYPSLVVRDPKYLIENGEINWIQHAPDDGFAAGTKHSNEVLPVGTLIDRYGSPSGRFVAPKGTAYEMRSLPYLENSDAYHVYRVIKPIENVNSGIIAAAFDQPGGGVQYQLPKTIASLLGEYLKEVK